MWYIIVISAILLAPGIIVTIIINKREKEQKKIEAEHYEKLDGRRSKGIKHFHLIHDKIMSHLNANPMEVSISTSNHDGVRTDDYDLLENPDSQVYYVTYKGKQYKVQMEEENLTKFVELPTNI